eukprot:5273276-Alexandrium_andersonii.AAC.1
MCSRRTKAHGTDGAAVAADPGWADGLCRLRKRDRESRGRAAEGCGRNAAVHCAVEQSRAWCVGDLVLSAAGLSGDNSNTRNLCLP